MSIPTVHNPTNFEPSDYEVVDYLDNKRPQYCGGPAEAYAQEVNWWETEMHQTFGDDWRKKIHHCAHCGNGMVRWITAVRHLPTDEVVVFGSDCTHRLGFANKMEFKLAQIQAKAEARRIRFARYTERQAFIAAHPGIADALAHIDEPVHAKNTFVRDVLSKLDYFGSLSDKQVSAVEASMKRDIEYAEKKAVEVAEVKGDAPSGRTVVTGTVISMREQETDFGTVTKMLVKLTNNAKVWVTAPSSVEKGDTITVRATWTVSKDDRSFAFGSRPHLISRTAAVEGVTL